ncbi:MAG: aminotransferase class I/II-fold pyridoxal phosphate-dependent enzyme [Gemmatimonadetes bacterium]|nr:aminotransferase class I/II-fold pyridoxal phosphate-dependent enzyme [Gemmatimonadota bacterium]NIO31246.1 aminotransferase class I/II-fold pyridoxal phosphate-dependent enzyme [Gemmatimonadota bacterium]
MAERIPLSRPDIGDAERAAVEEVLASGRLSLGPRLEAFEAELARVAGTEHAVATSSGTGALHLAVRAMGLAPGDEVVTTPFSFIASANCLLFEGVKPVFVDVEEDTLNIDPELVRGAVGKRTRAILGVDVFGHPADWDALRAIADEFDLQLIEDSAEALGSRYRGRRAGSLGDVGVFGFYPNKQITTGEGGALVTDDDALARLCSSLRNHGRESDGDEWVEHKRLGYNYRLSELACALGLVQLERLEAMAERRARVAAWYDERLADVDELHGPALREDVDLNWFVYVVRLSGRYARHDRDHVLAELRRRGIGCRNYFPPIHLQPVYRERYGHGPGDFPVSEAAAERTIALPFFSGMSEAQVDEVVEQLRDTL